MIVDGLGHVSLDSGAQQQQQAAAAVGQANIHQGSILATGRKQIAAAGSSPNMSSAPSTPMSAPTSLQYNQLIGGAVAPCLVMSNGGQAPTVATANVQQQGMNLVVANAGQQQQPQQQANLMIGDYLQSATAGFRQ